MNNFFWISLILSCLFVTGCHSEINNKENLNDHALTEVIEVEVETETNENNDIANGTNEIVITDQSSEIIDTSDIVNCEANPTPIRKFIRVQLTYGLLSEGPFIPGELGGTRPIEITVSATQGDTAIQVASTAPLVENQLLSYLGTNDRYSVAQIQSLTTNTITLTQPLLYDLAAGNDSLWNFYDNADHLNEFGSRALADYSYNSAFNVIEPNKVHALLGDSWFKRNGETHFADRLLERLPEGSVIQNEGIGGHSLCGLLGRVDDIIEQYNPNYVWINSSVNDFFDEVTQEEYKARMQTLIAKVQSAGAIAVVMDPAPGLLNQSTSGGITFTTLSRRYASQIYDLLNEAE